MKTNTVTLSNSHWTILSIRRVPHTDCSYRVHLAILRSFGREVLHCAVRVIASSPSAIRTAINPQSWPGYYAGCTVRIRPDRDTSQNFDWWRGEPIRDALHFREWIETIEEEAK